VIGGRHKQDSGRVSALARQVYQGAGLRALNL